MRGALVLVLCAAATSVLATGAGARPSADFTLCPQQIHHGPYLKWTLAIPGQASIHLSGTTWTVVAVGGMKCSKAMTVAHWLLDKKRFAAASKALANQYKPPYKGFDVCSLERTNGQVSCYALKKGQDVTAWQTDPVPFSKIKQIAAAGGLPTPTG
jgi:hypothetical protein